MHFLPVLKTLMILSYQHRQQVAGAYSTTTAVVGDISRLVITAKEFATAIINGEACSFFADFGDNATHVVAEDLFGHTR